MSLFFENDTDDMYGYFPGRFIYGDDVCISDEYMDEKWWYIDGMPNYMISNYGRVWSEKSHAFLKSKPMDREGHMGVCLYCNGKPKYVYIHRLMAKAFLSNPYNLPIVRHLNDIPYDNELNNLAWGTQRDNIQDAKRNGKTFRASPEIKDASLNGLRKPIIAIDLSTGEKTRFRGQHEASKILNIRQSNIWKVLNGERNRAGGYYFEYDKGCDK